MYLFRNIVNDLLEHGKETAYRIYLVLVLFRIYRKSAFAGIRHRIKYRFSRKYRLKCIQGQIAYMFGWKEEEEATRRMASAWEKYMGKRWDCAPGAYFSIPAKALWVLDAQESSARPQTRQRGTNEYRTKR